MHHARGRFLLYVLNSEVIEVPGSKHMQPPTPEELKAFGEHAAKVIENGLVCDAGAGCFYILAKQSRLEIEPRITKLTFHEVATLGITLFQVWAQMHTAAQRLAGDVKLT